MIRRLTEHAWILLGLIVAAGFFQQTATAQNRQPNRKVAPPPSGEHVFYASHSLMWYVPKQLGELAEAAHIKDHVLVGENGIGASRTLQHWEIPDANNKAKQALSKGDVSVFVMSPIQLPDEGIENFVKLGLQNNANMRFVVQLSWGGGDIDNQDFPKGAWDKVDKNKTPEQLQKLFVRNIQAGEAQADDLNKKYGRGKQIIDLVPSAQAVVALRTLIYNHRMPGIDNQNELFVDPAHPSPPLQALNTYLHYAVIYRQSPVGLPMPSVLKDAHKDAWGENCNKALQMVAWDTVSNYPYSGVAVKKSRPKAAKSS